MAQGTRCQAERSGDVIGIQFDYGERNRTLDEREPYTRLKGHYRYLLVDDLPTGKGYVHLPTIKPLRRYPFASLQ